MKYVLCRIDLSKGQSEVYKEFNRLHSKYGIHESCVSLDEIRDKLKTSDEVIIDNIVAMTDTEKKEILEQAIIIASLGYKVDIVGFVVLDKVTSELIQLIRDNLDFSSLSDEIHYIK